MPATGREFGLEVNDNVDERYHIEKATVAACKYFKQAYAKYGDWMLSPPPTMPDRDVSPPNSTNNWQVMPWTYGW